MNRPKPFRWLGAIALACTTLIGLAPAAAADDPTNDAHAVNTEDGGSVFRFAFSIRQVTNGLIDEKNNATAEASCVDCTTVALAFQVILVSGDADIVVPENTATAVNSECAECITYAAATQLVIGIDGMELTQEGKRRLKALEARMREVEKNANNMTDAELLAEAQAAEAELIAIFNEELVPIEQNGPSSTTTTSTTSPGATTTTQRTTTSTSAPDTTTTTQEAA